MPIYGKNLCGVKYIQKYTEAQAHENTPTDTRRNYQPDIFQRIYELSNDLFHRMFFTTFSELLEVYLEHVIYL